jgi:threonine dehydrogenase-like Zn-dependent dehydrogenase
MWVMRAVRGVSGAPTVAEVGDPVTDWPVLEVGSASICGSDLPLVGWNLPITLGHEIAGTLDGLSYCGGLGVDLMTSRIACVQPAHGGRRG